MLNDIKEMISILNSEDDILNEVVEREILDVVPSNRFTDRWLKITKNSMDNLREFMLMNFNNDSINPVLNEKRFSKKYKNLNKARKLRWNTITNKKSNNGDIRIISTYDPNTKCVRLLLCYKKSEQKDISELEAMYINDFIEEMKNGGYLR